MGAVNVAFPLASVVTVGPVVQLVSVVLVWTLYVVFGSPAIAIVSWLPLREMPSSAKFSPGVTVTWNASVAVPQSVAARIVMFATPLVPGTRFIVAL
jgi:hypothetical protein